MIKKSKMKGQISNYQNFTCTRFLCCKMKIKNKRIMKMTRTVKMVVETI